MFVLGCHRSGTSLLAGILAQALDTLCRQAPVETEASFALLPPQVDNPGGFQESQRIVQFNEQLLAALAIDWQRPPLHPIPWQDAHLFPQLFQARARFADQALNPAWVDKDPRLCITYSAYQHVLLCRVPCAAVLRHPFEVAASLQARDGLSLSHGLLIWFLYNQHMARAVNLQQDVLVAYETLLADPIKTGVSLATFLQRHAPFNSLEKASDQEAWPAQLSAMLMDRVRSDWCRSSHAWPTTVLPQPEWRSLAEHCLQCYEQIREAGFTIQAAQAALACTPESVLCAYAIHGWRPPQPAVAQPEPLHDSGLVGDLAFARADLQRLRQSTSWRLTAPLRWFGDRLRSKLA
jgi:hypothetical protein